MNAVPGVPLPKAGRYAISSTSRHRARSALSPSFRDADLKPAACPLDSRILPVGDTGLSVQFGTEIDPAINDAVAALDTAIAAADLPGIVETVPSFRSLLVVFEPASIDRETLLAQLRVLSARATRARRSAGRRWSLPVVYEPPFSEDLTEVSGLLGLSERDVVAAHTSAEFRVYMLGFQPGLPNLGGLPAQLQLSRRTTPRAPVPGGSVMIGGIQGAIMPLPTPSGFYLLGRTPVRLFDRRRTEPALLRAGDTVRFRAICADEFAGLTDAVSAGNLNAGATLEMEPA
jgi:inhibitor of KinA